MGGRRACAKRDPHTEPSCGFLVRTLASLLIAHASDAQSVLPPRAFRAAQALVLSGSIALLGVVATLVIFYVMASPTFGWTGAP